MLVLSRRIGQKIRIGNSIVVTLLKVDRNKARIGVEAPSGVPVFRQELLDFAKDRTVPAKVDVDCAQSPLVGRASSTLRQRSITCSGFAVPVVPSC